jgi:hypothetical protein
MRITFDDGSFIEFIPSDKERVITIIMCGIKDYKKLTMSASDLNEEQIDKLVEFVSEWKKK